MYNTCFVENFNIGNSSYCHKIYSLADILKKVIFCYLRHPIKKAPLGFTRYLGDKFYGRKEDLVKNSATYNFSAKKFNLSGLFEALIIQIYTLCVMCV